jgi:hypothetical protein
MIRTDVRGLGDYIRSVVEGPQGLLVRLAVVERDVASLADRHDDAPPDVPWAIPGVGGLVRLAAILGSLLGGVGAGAVGTWAAMHGGAEAAASKPVPSGTEQP